MLTAAVEARTERHRGVEKIVYRTAMSADVVAGPTHGGWQNGAVNQEACPDASEGAAVATGAEVKTHL